MRILVKQVVTILAISFSAVSMSQIPPKVPTNLYDKGPLNLIDNINRLSDPEIAAFELVESLALIAQAKVLATDCNDASGVSAVTIYADGSQGIPSSNFLRVDSFGGSLTLTAEILDPIIDRGQRVIVKQNEAGRLAGTVVSNFQNSASYNHPTYNLLTGTSDVQVLDNDDILQTYSSNVIKAISRGALSPVKKTLSGIYTLDSNYYTIIQWGLEALYNEGYAENKYWNRSKYWRGTGVQGRTISVKDQLVGEDESCRITVITKGHNTPDFFWQTGELVIDVVAPGTPIPEFTLF